MPITRKQQITAALETTEGGGATLTANDAVQVFDPSISSTTATLERVPAGASLSRDVRPVGRKSREITFKSDLRGSGSTSTAPDFSRFLQASGFKSSLALRVLTLGAVSVGTGFQPGEQVTQSGGVTGVILAVLTSAGVPIANGDTSGQKIVVAVTAGTMTAAATTGVASGSTSTASAAADYAGFAYQPTSEKLLQVDTGAWAPSTPSLGDVVLVMRSGLPVGAVQITRSATSATDLDVAQVWGEIANGDDLQDQAGNAATISTDPVMIRTPSLAIGHNLDGRLRKLVGARGDFTLEGQVYEPVQFTWTFTGDPDVDSDALPLTTTGLSTVRAPRMLGGIFVYGKDALPYRLPTKRISLAMGNTSNPNLDANRAGGTTGANITDRQPIVTVSVDMAHSSFDWEALNGSGAAVRFAMVLGDTAGNIVALAAPICQVIEAGIADADGVATFDVQLAALRQTESGDDELFIAQL